MTLVAPIDRGPVFGDVLVHRELLIREGLIQRVDIKRLNITLLL